MTRPALIAAVVVALLVSACQQQTAEISSEPPVIEERSTGGADSDASGAREVLSPDEPTALVPTETLTSAPTIAEASPVPDDSDGDPQQTNDQLQAWDTDLPARWAAMGCGDATDIQVWLFDSNEVVAAAAKKMPIRLWLCPDNAEVNTELECYQEETANLLTVIGEELGASVAEAVSGISVSNTVFCASGTAIRLPVPNLTPAP